MGVARAEEPLAGPFVSAVPYHCLSLTNFGRVPQTRERADRDFALVRPELRRTDYAIGVLPSETAGTRLARSGMFLGSLDFLWLLPHFAISVRTGTRVRP